MPTFSISISGSFHRHMKQIEEAVKEFTEYGVKVLSPADPRVVDSIGPFLFVASDQHRSIRLVQDRHLAAISQSDFLWLVSPDGYIGQSASLELGFAIAYGIPIFCESIPPDLTLQQYVIKVSGINKLMEDIKKAGSVDLVVETKLKNRKMDQVNLLLDPVSAVDLAHNRLEDIGKLLINRSNVSKKDISPELLANLEELRKILSLTEFR